MAKKAEVIALKMQIIDINEKLEISTHALTEIDKIIKQAIKYNLNKTNRTEAASITRIYREELLTLREIEQELTDYKNRLGLEV